MSSEEEENYDDESFDEEYEDEFDNESEQEDSGANEHQGVSSSSTEVKNVSSDDDHHQQNILGVSKNGKRSEESKVKGEANLDEKARHEEMDQGIDATMHSTVENIEDEKGTAVNQLEETGSNTLDTAISVNTAIIDTREGDAEYPQIPEDEAKDTSISNFRDNLLENRDEASGIHEDPNPGGSAFSSAVDLFPFASTSSSILENPEGEMPISAYDMFVAKGPHLPNLI
eukprot:g9396.t1